MDKRIDIRPLSHMGDGERTHLGVRQGSGKDRVPIRLHKCKSVPNNFQYMYNKQWKISIGKLIIIIVLVLVVVFNKRLRLKLRVVNENIGQYYFLYGI